MAITNNKLSQKQYAENFSDIHPPFETKDAALVEASRCLFCYDAPCMKSCPTGIDVPKFIKQISTENLKGAAHTILSSNIMGAGCSKVCQSISQNCSVMLPKLRWGKTGNYLKEKN